MIERTTVPSVMLGRPIRKIAVVRALKLGDLLVAVPAFRSLRAGFPEAEITLIGLPWAAELVRRFHRYLDRFLAFPGYPGIAEAPVDAGRTAGFLEQQRVYRYDLVVQMHGSGSVSTPFAVALGGRITAGFYVGDPPAGLTLGMEYRDEGPEVVRNLRLTRLLGCPDRGTDLEFPLSGDDRTQAVALLPRRAGLRVGLHTGASAPERRWPTTHFAAVGDHLAREYGAQIVLTGGPDETATVREVALGMETPPVNLAGRTSLGVLAALISELDLFISNDTGPAHLARAVDTPSVTIFGPADLARWAPLDTARHRVAHAAEPCDPGDRAERLIDDGCLDRPAPETVIELATDLLPTGAVACPA